MIAARKIGTFAYKNSEIIVFVDDDDLDYSVPYCLANDIVRIFGLKNQKALFDIIPKEVMRGYFPYEKHPHLFVTKNGVEICFLFKQQDSTEIGRCFEQILGELRASNETMISNLKKNSVKKKLEAMKSFDQYSHPLVQDFAQTASGYCDLVMKAETWHAVFCHIGKAAACEKKVQEIVKKIELKEEMDSIRNQYPFLVPDAAAVAIDLLKNAVNSQSMSDFQNYANQAEFYVKEVQEALKWIIIP